MREELICGTHTADVSFFPPTDSENVLHDKLLDAQLISFKKMRLEYLLFTSGALIRLGGKVLLKKALQHRFFGTSFIIISFPEIKA